MYKLVW